MMSVQFDTAKIKAAGRDLSDQLANMTWKRFWLIALLLMIAFGSLRDVDGLGALGALGTPLVFFLIIAKLQAKSRARAVGEARSAEIVASAALGEARDWKAKLDSHFLFNAMATIEHLMESDPPKALLAQRALATYLRSGLSEPETSSAKAQAAACDAYLAIQKIRMGDRLEFSSSWRADAPMPGRIAIAALESVVAACVEPSIHGGRVDLSCRRTDSGMSWEMLFPRRDACSPDFEALKDAWLANAPAATWTVSQVGEPGHEQSSKLALEWIPAGYARKAHTAVDLSKS